VLLLKSVRGKTALKLTSFPIRGRNAAEQIGKGSADRMNIPTSIIFEIAMPNTTYKEKIKDSDIHTYFENKDCRRTGFDRRCFTYSLYIPERRSHLDRRKGNSRLRPERI
jgi:hypothetical protein